MPEAISGSVTAELGKVWHHEPDPELLPRLAAQTLPRYFRKLVIPQPHITGFFGIQLIYH